MAHWIKDENHDWINLDKAYWIFVRQPISEGYIVYQVCVDFDSDVGIHVISTHESLDVARIQMDAMMRIF
jgi:hypothetical protein